MKKTAIQFQLFISYSTLIIIFIILTTGFFYYFSSETLKNHAVEYISQLSIAITGGIDNEIRQMDDISKRVAYSNLLKDRFISYLDDPSEINLYLNQTVLRDIFIAIMGPLEKWYQINLYDFEGSYVGAGINNAIGNLDLSKEFWYEDTLTREGARFLTAPYMDTEGLGDPQVISLNRVYYDNVYHPIGIIEIQYEVDHIFQAVLKSVYTSGDKEIPREIFVFGSGGNLIYPFDPDPQINYDLYYQTAVDSEESSKPITLKEENGASKRIMTSVRSEYSGWYIIVAVEENDLLKPVYVFTRMMIIFCLITIISSLFISYFIANRLSRPIKQLESTVSALTLESFPEDMLDETGREFNEIESLLASFRDMHSRLRQSANELVTSQSRELESRMMALQAKMNPHFLYNTIATINVLADEQGNQEIKMICRDMSGMLRYISSEAMGNVQLNEEIEQTERYLNLMKHRYENNLEFRINMDKDILKIQVPRLIIQPFVENSLKYGITEKPPWIIGLRGFIEENQWIVEISDNGKGFHQDKIKDLNEKIHAVKPDEIRQFHSLEGMGILNIYTRLKLLYREDLLFSIENDLNGGARILIGGPLEG